MCLCGRSCIRRLQHGQSGFVQAVSRPAEVVCGPQEEKKQLRQDACQLAEAQHEALLQAKAHVEELQADKVKVTELLGELKAALQQAVQENRQLREDTGTLAAVQRDLQDAR